MARIAIVDDSRLVRVFAAGALRTAGHEVVEVEPSSMADVLRVIREAPLDLLVADLLMPNCSGESLVRVCREDTALDTLPILIMSAHRDDLGLTRLMKLGISGFLLKPVDASALVARVAETLAPEPSGDEAPGAEASEE